MPATLLDLVTSAFARGASDLHLEPLLPPALRIDGRLHIAGPPATAALIEEMARSTLGGVGWERFCAEGSADLSRAIAGVRCRINVLRTRRGIGMAVRLLPGEVPTLERSNLHPSFAQLAALPHGLVLVSGPTGSGKSSTVAAIVQEINCSSARHVITLEAPVEHWFRPARSFIRQREVGTDTDSFARGLRDALREDPDVLVVGELRDPETMRLTLDAAETGHLVLSTVHSGSVAEALQRVISAHAPEARDGVRSQLAGCLAAVVCQRLVIPPGLDFPVPECEVLRASDAMRSCIRADKLAQLATVLETGADVGSFTRERYRRWVETGATLLRPSRAPSAEAEGEGQGRDEGRGADGRGPGGAERGGERAPRHARSRGAQREGDGQAADGARGRRGAEARGEAGVFVLDDIELDTAAALDALLKR